MEEDNYKIVKIKKNHDGIMTDVMLENGAVFAHQSRDPAGKRRPDRRRYRCSGERWRRISANRSKQLPNRQPDGFAYLQVVSVIQCSGGRKIAVSRLTFKHPAKAVFYSKYLRSDTGSLPDQSFRHTLL